MREVEEISLSSAETQAFAGPISPTIVARQASLTSPCLRLHLYMLYHVWKMRVRRYDVWLKVCIVKLLILTLAGRTRSNHLANVVCCMTSTRLRPSSPSSHHPDLWQEVWVPPLAERQVSRPPSCCSRRRRTAAGSLLGAAGRSPALRWRMGGMSPRLAVVAKSLRVGVLWVFVVEVAESRGGEFGCFSKLSEEVTAPLSLRCYQSFAR